MKEFKEILYISFIVLMFFSYSITFLNTFENAYIHTFVDIYYIIKKILIVVIGLSIPFCLRRISVSFMIICMGIIFFLSAYAFSPERSEIINLVFFDYFGCLLIFHCVVSLSCPFSNLLKYLLWGSRIMFLLITFTLLTQADIELSYFIKKNYMLFANAIMIPLSIELYSFIIKKKYFDAILAFVFLFLLFMGSRGSMVSILLLIVFLYFLNNKKTNRNNNIFTSLVILIGIYIFSQLIDYGIIDFSDNRTLTFLTKGTNLNEEDRILIWRQVINGTSNVFIGDGIFADRQILLDIYRTNMAYAHNVFVESFSDFGIIGLFFMIWLYYKIIMTMFKQSDNQLIVVVFFFISAFQLLFSRSVLLEYNFFILLGLVYLSSTKYKHTIYKA